MHPASIIDRAAVSARLLTSLTGGPYWDPQSAKHRPDLTFDGAAYLEYEWEGLHEAGFSDIEQPDVFDFTDPAILNPLKAWCDHRVAISHATLLTIPIADGLIRAHRLVKTRPEDLRPALGIFWCHYIGNWDERTAPWGPAESEDPTILITASVPAKAVDWETSCAALCDWYCGDMESELRLAAGRMVFDLTAENAHTDEPIFLRTPSGGWTT